MRLSRALPAAVLAAVGCWLALLASIHAGRAQAARASVNCRSGRTVFHHGGIRGFVLVRRTEANNPISAFKVFYFCAHGSRHPRVFNEGAPFTSETVDEYKLVGDRLGFVSSAEGVSGGSGTSIGWVALRTGLALQAPIYEAGVGGEEEEQEIVKGELLHVPLWHFNYAIAPDGAVALVGESESHASEVFLVTVKKTSLSRPKLLFKSKTHQEAIDPHSLAVSNSAVTWKTIEGASVSMPRAPLH